MVGIRHSLLLLVVLETVLIYDLAQVYIPGLPKKYYKKEGKFTIGLIMSVHKLKRRSFCGTEVSGLHALQRLEAVDFTVDEINRRQDLLKNQSLGFVIYDDCNKDVTALAQSLRFKKSESVICNTDSPIPSPMLDDIPRTTCLNESLVHHDVIGVIACERSSLTVQVANLLTAFKIPQISYMSTTSVLSQKGKYPFFQRPIPADSDQVGVIIQILKQFNWRFVSVVYTEGSYGAGAFNELRYRAEYEGICFAETYEIGHMTTQQDYTNIVDSLMKVSDKASVVILFAYLPEVRTIIESYKWMNMRMRKKITWIASDSWGNHLNELKGIEPWTVGMLSIKIRMSNVPRFDKYFQSLTPERETSNPWRSEFWSAAFGCTNDVENNGTNCPPNLSFNNSEHYKPDKYTSVVMDTVYTYAHALDNVMNRYCSNYVNSSLFLCVEQHLFESLRSVDFDGELGPVYYDEDGDGPPAYEILNMQKVGDSYRLHDVGYWDMTNENLVFNQNKTMWVGGSLPKSICGVPCGVAHEPRRREAKCCWDCEPCQRNQITVGRRMSRKCSNCPDKYWPEAKNRTICLKIAPRFIVWNGPIGITFSVICCCGAFACIVIGVLFILNNKNRLIKSSSRELSYIMLVGIFLSYALVMTFIGNLYDGKCVLHLFGIGLSFTCMYSPLITKTNRIYRIFLAGKKTSRRPPLIDSKYQVIIAFLIIGVHALILTISMSVWTPKREDITASPEVVDAVCEFPVVPFALALVYNVILVFICAFYAFKTRMLPDNYNESKFIAFCVYSTLFLWCAFVPVYFVIPVGYYRIVVIMITVSFNATVILICMYIPKIFAIYCVDVEKLKSGSDLVIATVSSITPNTTTKSSVTPNTGYNNEGTKPKIRFATKNKVYPIT